jgi:hypothetical protein
MMESAESAKDNARCKDCGVQFTDVKDCDDMDFDSLERKRRKGSWSDFDDESDSEVKMRKKSRRWKNEKSRKDKTPVWIEQEGKNILPSAKPIEIKV